MENETSRFVAGLQLKRQFGDALIDEDYRMLPDDWLVAVTDVVSSRRAIADGRYKAVNMAGVSMISAVMNALDHAEFPYVFGGDGAAIAFAPQQHEIVRATLAKTVNWVSKGLSLQLRAAIVPISRLKSDGYEVKIASVAVSDNITNFAFAGGGVSHAEDLMKQGEFLIDHQGAGADPDLTGMSCRWTPVNSADRKVASIIISPSDDHLMLDAETGKRILALVGGDGDSASPMPGEGPGFKWPPEGLVLEAEATRGASSLLKQKILLYLITLLAWVLDRTGWSLGEFDPVRYRQQTSINTDFRKVQDGIKMTVFVSDAQLQQLTEFLDGQMKRGLLKYGICVQDSAVLTCFVPSIMSDAHYHFLDGAGGGYAQAATNMQKH